MDTKRKPRHDAGFFEGWEFKSWGEAIATLALMLIVCVGVVTFLCWAFITADRQPYEYEDTILYWVEEGDTLWTIARHYSTDKQDVRRVIDMIEELNDCTATIYPGQCLTIPVFQ